MAKIQSIYICAQAAMPMTLQERIQVTISKGINNDRYGNQIGSFSNSNPSKVRNITLIASKAITQANHLLDAQNLPCYTAAETRRNLVIDQITPEDLNALVGKIFYLGAIRLRGTELCDPCNHPAKLANKESFRSAFKGVGGIRAEILDSGEIMIGSHLVIADET
jgi:MOSC domain-containing protein YiiM